MVLSVTTASSLPIRKASPKLRREAFCTGTLIGNRFTFYVQYLLIYHITPLKTNPSRYTRLFIRTFH